MRELMVGWTDSSHVSRSMGLDVPMCSHGCEQGATGPAQRGGLAGRQRRQAAPLLLCQGPERAFP